MKKLFSKQQIEEAVSRIANQILDENNGEPPVMICVLNGAFMFFSDLVKELNHCEIDFIKVKSYQNQLQFDIKILNDITTDIKGKNVYIIDDILDSGNTMKAIIHHLEQKQPHSIHPVTLFKKQENTWPIIYGFDITDEYWIYGYGLDGENGLYRNLTAIFGMSKEID